MYPVLPTLLWGCYLLPESLGLQIEVIPGFCSPSGTLPELPPEHLTWGQKEHLCRIRADMFRLQCICLPERLILQIYSHSYELQPSQSNPGAATALQTQHAAQGLLEGLLSRVKAEECSVLW